MKAIGFDQVILEKDGVLQTQEQFDKVLELVGPSAILDTFGRTAEGAGLSVLVAYWVVSGLFQTLIQLRCYLAIST